MTCQEKKKYRNLFIAEWAMDDVKSRYGETKTPYLCQECNAYHLTSNNPNYKRSFPVNTIMPQGRVSLIIRHNKHLMNENMALEAKLEDLEDKIKSLEEKYRTLFYEKQNDFLSKKDRRVMMYIKEKGLLDEYVLWGKNIK